MTDKHLTERAYDKLEADELGLDDYLYPLPVFNAPFQTQFRAIREYEEQRHKSNKAFREQYLTPASTDHIASEETQDAIEYLQKPSGAAPSSENDNNQDNPRVTNITTTIDHYVGRKDNGRDHDITGTKGIITVGSLTGTLAALATGIVTSTNPPGMAFTAAAALSYAATHLTKHDAEKAKEYYEANKALTNTENGEKDTFRHDVMGVNPGNDEQTVPTYHGLYMN